MTSMGAGSRETDQGDHGLAGVYYALVTRNQGDEEHPAQVKVRLPWMPEGDQDELPWAHVAAPMAGSSFGVYTLPEVGDTVLVAFLAGDIHHPVVLGGLWSKQDEPPETDTSGDNDARLVKSRSGHRLVFEDSGEDKVFLEARSEAHVAGCGRFADAGSSTNRRQLPAPGAINGTPKEGVSVAAATGTMRLHCPQGTLRVDARHVEVTARAKVEVKASGSVSVEGSGPGKVAASEEVKLQGSRITGGA